MHNKFGILLAAVLIMGIMSYPVPITNSNYDNGINLETGPIGIAFAQSDDFEDEFADKEFEDEHDEFADKEFEDGHDKEDDRERDENEKVKVCHFPEGDDDNPVTIEIARSALRPHLNHGDFFGGCEQFGSSDHDREDDKDREEREHDVPNELKKQIGIVLDKFTPEELEAMMQEEGPRGTASIIAEQTDLSFREAQKLVDFVMKEMERDDDREDHDFPKNMDDKIEIVMTEFTEDELMEMMEDIGPDQTAEIIVMRTSLTIDEARELVGFAMKEMEKDHEGINEDHERDDEDIIGGIMEGEYPTDKYVDGLLEGITSGGESIGGWFGGESDDIKNEPPKDKPEDDMFGGLFGIFGGEEDEMRDDFDDDFKNDFDDDFKDFDESSRDSMSHEAEERLAEMEDQLAERDRELERAQETITELEDRLGELEKRFELIMEMIANQ